MHQGVGILQRRSSYWEGKDTKMVIYITLLDVHVTPEQHVDSPL